MDRIAFYIIFRVWCCIEFKLFLLEIHKKNTQEADTMNKTKHWKKVTLSKDRRPNYMTQSRRKQCNAILLVVSMLPVKPEKPSDHPVICILLMEDNNPSLFHNLRHLPLMTSAFRVYTSISQITAATTQEFLNNGSTLRNFQQDHINGMTAGLQCVSNGVPAVFHYVIDI